MLICKSLSLKGYLIDSCICDVSVACFIILLLTCCATGLFGAEMLLNIEWVKQCFLPV